MCALGLKNIDADAHANDGFEVWFYDGHVIRCEYIDDKIESAATAYTTLGRK
jgi:hypothetical protein